MCGNVFGGSITSEFQEKRARVPTVGTFRLLSHTYQHFCTPPFSPLYHHHDVVWLRVRVIALHLQVIAATTTTHFQSSSSSLSSLGQYQWRLPSYIDIIIMSNFILCNLATTFNRAVSKDNVKGDPTPHKSSQSNAVLVTPPTIPAGMTGFRWNETGIRWNRYKLPYLGIPLLNNNII